MVQKRLLAVSILSNESEEARSIDKRRLIDTYFVSFPIWNCFLIVHKIREISAGKGDFEGGQEKSVEVKDFFNGLEKYVFSQLTQGNFRTCPSFFSIYC